MPIYADPALTGFPPVEVPSPPPTAAFVQHAGQSLLLYVAGSTLATRRVTVVDARGDRALGELEYAGPMAPDLLDATDGDWPITPGFHIWEGSIFASPPGRPRLPVGWVGEWRRATHAEAEAYSRTTPAPATPDRA